MVTPQRLTINSAMIAALIAAISGLAWLFSIHEAVAVQRADLEGLQRQYEQRLEQMQKQLMRIEDKVDHLQRR